MERFIRAKKFMKISKPRAESSLSLAWTLSRNKSSQRVWRDEKNFVNFDTWKLGKTRHNKYILHDWPSQPKVWFYLGIKSNWISCTEIFKAGSLKKVQNENIYWWDEFNRSFSYKSRHGHWEKVSRYWMMCKSDALKSCQKKLYCSRLTSLTWLYVYSSRRVHNNILVS